MLYLCKKAGEKCWKQIEKQESSWKFFNRKFVPREYLLRKIDSAVDFTHIYDFVSVLYSEDIQTYLKQLQGAGYEATLRSRLADEPDFSMFSAGSPAALLAVSTEDKKRKTVEALLDR